MRSALLSLLAALLLGAPPASGLERVSVAADPGEPAWTAGTTCTIAYYNFCTGWVWGWSAISGERIGVVFELGAQSSRLAVLETSVYCLSGAPCGWGYVGAMRLFAVDENDCPTGSPLASAAFCAEFGWNQMSWAGVTVPHRFASVIEYTQVGGWPLRIASDHPAAGATGPQACGTCYPSDRETHSYRWGAAAGPLCPGSPLNDDVCDAEFLWRASLRCATEVGDGIVSQSWSRLKQMYR